jgi:UDP-N-acetylglucosamine 2-epimerase (hydrolysing)
VKSHIHLTANLETKKRLLQLGEYEESIQIIGSPDLDLMNSKKLPTLEEVKSHYEIPFSNYAIAIYHPVTTDYKNINLNIKNFVDSLIESHEHYIVVYPNNDLGTLEILNEYKKSNIQNISLYKV